MFVSHRGQDEDFCGDRILPCRSVRQAVNISCANTVIFIDCATERPYSECNSQNNIVLNKNLSFHGMNGTAILQCQCYDCEFFTIESLENDSFVRMAFKDLILSTTVDMATRIASYSNFQLVFTGCTLNNY